MPDNRIFHVLVIDDEEDIREGCRQALGRKGFAVDCADDAFRGLELASGNRYDAILLDIRMPKMDGMALLRKLRQESRIAAKVLVITGHGTIPLAVEAMKQGAADFLTKPFTPQDLRDALRDALEGNGPEPAADDTGALIGPSEYLRELRASLQRIAQTDSTVLITGESGTGKERVAKAIHRLSHRADRPFVPVDCSSLVENLMESELFGHTRGAFSGATETRDGRFQMAHRGTLFLDEVANIGLGVQAKLLRAIQEKEVPRVGRSLPERVDVRLVAATNRDIRREIEAGRFREDLFYRLSVIPIELKPLREHRADIVPIAQHYLDLYREQHRSRVHSLSEEAKKSLLAYAWPGNVRELQNTMERLSVLCDRETVEPADILYYGQAQTRAPAVDFVSGRMTLLDVEKEHIVKALRHFQFRVKKTAEFLGIDRKTLRLKMRQYGIEAEN